MISTLLFVSSLFLPCWLMAPPEYVSFVVGASSEVTQEEDKGDFHSNQTQHPSDDGERNSIKMDVYRLLGVPLPTRPIFNLSRLSWKFHGRILPYLHRTVSSSSTLPKAIPAPTESGETTNQTISTLSPPDVFVNLRVLWCKALSSFNVYSPAYEYNHSNNRRSNNESDSSLKNTKSPSLMSQLPPLPPSIFTTYNMNPSSWRFRLQQRLLWW